MSAVALGQPVDAINLTVADRVGELVLGRLGTLDPVSCDMSCAIPSALKRVDGDPDELFRGERILSKTREPVASSWAQLGAAYVNWRQSSESVELEKAERI
jgi:hypothetical protein